MAPLSADFSPVLFSFFGFSWDHISLMTILSSYFFEYMPIFLEENFLKIHFLEFCFLQGGVLVGSHFFDGPFFDACQGRSLRCFYLSICLSVCLSVCLCLCVSLKRVQPLLVIDPFFGGDACPDYSLRCVSIYLSVCLFVFMCVYVCVRVCVRKGCK